MRTYLSHREGSSHHSGREKGESDSGLQLGEMHCRCWGWLVGVSEGGKLRVMKFELVKSGARVGR